MTTRIRMMTLVAAAAGAVALGCSATTSDTARAEKPSQTAPAETQQITLAITGMT